jgi:hypothetical protein
LKAKLWKDVKTESSGKKLPQADKVTNPLIQKEEPPLGKKKNTTFFRLKIKKKWSSPTPLVDFYTAETCDDLQSIRFASCISSSKGINQVGKSLTVGSHHGYHRRE